jgi:small GTP-binding protein
MADRLTITVFGRRNVGKSSLVNAITGQDVAVTSPVAGTTTDPVVKAMELLPIGPVVFIDTAGLDDEGELGALRVERTYETVHRTHFALIVVTAEQGFGLLEAELLGELRSRDVECVVVLNKADLAPEAAPDVSPDAAPDTAPDAAADLAPDAAVHAAELARELAERTGARTLAVSATTGDGIAELKRTIGETAHFDDSELGLVGGLMGPGGIAVLVTPIDKAAPKGRLILPQQQVIRDVLEGDAIAVVTKEHELKHTLDSLAGPPAVVITDSQAFLKVAADTPPDVPMTSFSILFARQKGDLAAMVRALSAIENLKPGGRVLVVEGCTHHRQSDDIGTVKIPRWIRQIAGGDIHFEWASGARFPRDVSGYDAIVHCGGCMLNRREMAHRLAHAASQGVPMTNYGVLIAHVLGVLPRAIEPFPAAALAYEGVGARSAEGAASPVVAQ